MNEKFTLDKLHPTCMCETKQWFHCSLDIFELESDAELVTSQPKCHAEGISKFRIHQSILCKRKKKPNSFSKIGKYKNLFSRKHTYRCKFFPLAELKLEVIS